MSVPNAAPERHGFTMEDEFASLDSYSDPLDRMEAATVLLEEYFDGLPPSQLRGWGSAFHATEESPVQHYVLNDFTVQEQAVERVYDNPYKMTYHSMYNTGNYMYGRIEQQGIWVFPPGQKRYVRASMDQCSLIAATRQDGSILAAHVGYSERTGVEAVLGLMEKQGFSPRDAMVVAATTQENAHHPASMGTYVQAGIPAANILTFGSSKEEIDDNGTILLRNASEVVVSEDALFAYRVDVTYPYRGQELKGPLHDEVLVDMSPGVVGRRIGRETAGPYPTL